MSKKNKKTEEEIKLEKEIKEYQKPSFFSKIPYGVKAELIKYWFYGALFFFIGMGMSVQGELLALLGGLIGGLVCKRGMDGREPEPPDQRKKSDICIWYDTDSPVERKRTV